MVVMFLAGGVNPSAAKLVVNTAKQPTNPLGRPLRICAPVEIGFQQRKGVTWNSYNHTATKRTHCFSAMLGNLETIAGFDVDLMKQVTDLLGWEYEWIVYPGYNEVLYHTRIGDCDVGFGCFNQNSMRIQCHATPSKGQSWGSVDTGCPLYSSPSNTTTTDEFSLAACCLQPLLSHLTNGWGIMARTPFTSKAKRMMDTLESAFVMNWLIWLLTGILIFGHLIWLLERSANGVNGCDIPQWPMSLAQGGQEGVWWALVTTTTVGYGDVSVRNGLARLLTAAWMAMGFISMACLIGAITSTLTATEADTAILTAAGLKGKRVCTHDYYSGSLASEYAAIEITCPSNENCPANAKNRAYGSTGYFAQCFELLESGFVDAVVFEHAGLSAVRAQTEKLSRFSLGRVFAEISQSGWVEPRSTVTKQLNWALSKVIQNSKVYEGIANKWFGDPSKLFVAENEPESVDTGQLIVCLLLWSVFIVIQVISSFLPCTDALLQRIGRGPGGLAHFVFGTAEERKQFKDLNQVDDSRWDCLLKGSTGNAAVVPEEQTTTGPSDAECSAIPQPEDGGEDGASDELPTAVSPF